MEEKKTINISLSTFFIIIAIILIIVVFYLYIVQKNKDALLEQENLNMKNEISSLKEQVNDYRDKIDKVLKVATENNNEKSISTNEKSILTQDEAKNIIKEKIDKLDDMYFDSNKVFQIASTADSEGRYLIKNSDQVISEYLTSTAKNNFKGFCIIKENGKYYLVEGGGFASYEGLKSIENIKISDTEIIANIITKHNDPDGNSIDDKSTEIKLVKIGNNWLISTFNWDIFQ